MNSTLLAIGERQVSAFTSYPAQKAVDACQDALQELLDRNDWIFTRSQINASSWSGAEATLPEFVRLLGVSVALNSTLSRSVLQMTWDEFNKLSPSTGVPRYFTVTSQTTVEVDPAPAASDTDLQDDIWFDVIQPQTIPSETTDTFPVPERFIRFIKTYATARMLEDHLDDPSRAQLNYQRAEVIITQLVRREPGRAIGQRTMWRGSRPYRNI